jgi:hypothetical protein
MIRRFGLAFSMVALLCIQACSGDLSRHTIPTSNEGPPLPVKPSSRPDLHCTLYEDIPFSTMGCWMDTGITIPRGAIVAIVLRGEQFARDTSPWGAPQRRPACNTVRYRIGSNGLLRKVMCGYQFERSHNVEIFCNWETGLLQGYVIPGQRTFGDFAMTVAVWEETQHSFVEADVEMMTRDAPEGMNAVGLWTRL